MQQSDKRVLVTGASRGIGYEVTKKLLEQDFRVIGTARSSEFPSEFTESGRFTGMHVDLGDEQQLRERIKPLFGADDAPSVLVNNAGISEPADPENGDEQWLENWHRTMMVNLHAPALISKWALNRWSRENNGGILITIASRAAYRGDTRPFASYAASKSAMVGFTKSVARGYGERNIAAYSIAPGFVETDMAEELKEVYGEDYLKKDIALPDLTPPREVAEVVALLASGNVRHLTGSSIHINGGSYML